MIYFLFYWMFKFPAALLLICIGTLLSMTVVLAPVGLPLIAVGNQMLKYRSTTRK